MLACPASQCQRRGVSIDNRTSFSLSPLCACLCVRQCVCEWGRERERDSKRTWIVTIHTSLITGNSTGIASLPHHHRLSANHYATNLPCLLLLLSSTHPLSPCVTSCADGYFSCNQQDVEDEGHKRMRKCRSGKNSKKYILKIQLVGTPSNKWKWPVTWAKLTIHCMDTKCI